MTPVLQLDAEALYRELRAACASLRAPTPLVGITSGGAWLAERLQKDLGLPGSAGVISSAMHRDDFSRRGLAGRRPADPAAFDVNGTHRCCSTTCCTPAAPSARCSTSCLTMAARPACGWPCWWTAAGASCRWKPTLPPPAWPCRPAQSLALARSDDGRFSFQVENKAEGT
jgi:pyrimidine operon attenuation protein/uracil phosphoribosyltransferase